MYRSEDLSACVRSSLPRTLTRPTHFFPSSFLPFFLEPYIPLLLWLLLLEVGKKEGKREKVVLLVLLVLALLSLLLCLRVCFWFHSSPLLGLSLTHSLTLTGFLSLTFSLPLRFPFCLSVCPSACLPCPVPTLH